jgi:hypothetical protein
MSQMPTNIKKKNKMSVSFNITKVLSTGNRVITYKDISLSLIQSFNIGRNYVTKDSSINNNLYLPKHRGHPS